MIWPKRPGSWNYGAKKAREAFKRVAWAIAESEEVFMLAEPDVEEAAGYMRRLYEDPAYYDRLAKNGKAKINEVLGAQTITAMLKERLAPILQAAGDAQADRA